MADFQAGLFPHIVDELGAIPSALLRQHVTEIVRDFCTQTQVWFETIDIQLVAGQAEYTFTPTDAVNTQFSGLKEVWITDPVAEPRLLEPRWEYISSDKGGWTVKIANFPGAGEAVPAGASIRGVFALRPTAVGTDIPDRIFQDWYLPISQGVKARLMRMTNRHWANVELSREYWVEYIGGIRRCRYDIERSSTTGHTQVSFPLGYRF